MGVAYDKLKDYDNAIKSYQKAIDINPKMSNKQQILKYIKTLKKLLN